MMPAACLAEALSTQPSMEIYMSPLLGHGCRTITDACMFLQEFKILDSQEKINDQELGLKLHLAVMKKNWWRFPCMYSKIFDSLAHYLDLYREMDANEFVKETRQLYLQILDFCPLITEPHREFTLAELTVWMEMYSYQDNDPYDDDFSEFDKYDDSDQDERIAFCEFLYFNQYWVMKNHVYRCLSSIMQAPESVMKKCLLGICLAKTKFKSLARQLFTELQTTGDPSMEVVQFARAQAHFFFGEFQTSARMMEDLSETGFTPAIFEMIDYYRYGWGMSKILESMERLCL